MESSREKLWLWDLYPLADDAWPNVSLAIDVWSDWLKEPGQTMVLRRWVPGPNGPSFLAEYTPADDYITEGFRGPHDTFNSLYRDEDRPFYVPRPEDLAVLKRLYPQADPAAPDWSGVRVALCRAGHRDLDLAMAKAPVLIGYLDELSRKGTPDKSAGDFRQIDGDEEQHEAVKSKPEAKKRGKRGPKRLSLKEAWRYVTVLQEWTGIQERNQKLAQRDRVRKVQVAEKHDITVRELDAMLGWYAKHRGQGLFPDDPRTLSKGELQKWFE